MRLQFQRRKLNSGEPDKYIIIKLHYPRPNSIRIMKGNTVIKPVSLLDNAGENELDTTMCGSNKYFYFNNSVHFVVTGALDCMVRVSVTNSLQLTARFAMDINDFFISDRATLFIDRLCALLLIQDKSRVKIVGIYQGSVQIVAVIEEQVTLMDDAPSNDNTQQAVQLSSLQKNLNALLDDGSFQSDMVSVGLTGFQDL